MDPTTLHLHTQHTIGAVDPRIFGGFLEHMGRAVYEGVYDPQSAHAGSDGFRTDVLAALRRLDMTVVRYPGGNFASGYHWRDGVGAREERPTVRELAWQSIEPNRVGTDEFMALCHGMGWAPMLTVNLGTGTPEEARDWVEYCNSPTGTRYADMRASNGSAAPHAVPLWCLGNEMDGPWQLGHVPADQYAIRAQQAAKMMRDVDRSIELVACGSCTVTLPTYLEWDRQVLETLGDEADYISLHRYVGNRANDTRDYLATGLAIERQIEEMDAVCRWVQGKRRSTASNARRAYLCFDEWNVWYKNQQKDGAGKFAPHLIEEVYNLEDALVVAGFFNAFLRHADVLKIANIAQIVNVIAPILTRGDELLLQSIFYPFAMYAKRREGVSLRVAVEGPAYDTPTHGTASFIDASAILDGLPGSAGRAQSARANHGGTRLHVFLVNRSVEEEAHVRIALADRPITAIESAEMVSGPDAKAANTYERPDVVVARPFSDVQVVNGVAELALPRLSVAAVTVNL